MLWIRIIATTFFALSLFILTVVAILSKKNNNRPTPKTEGHHFAVLIPARYESLVIENLLISLKNQTVPIDMKDIYVIVESQEDETVHIANRYGVSVVLRQKLELQRKGYALDEAMQEIFSKGLHYDAYFIFDADNTVDKDFVKNMIPVFDKGYDIACGYRNSKNGNSSVVAAASSLTFSLLNTLFNNIKNRQTRNITFSGTGLYIRGSLLEKFGGFPFHELTEDYEMSLYAMEHNLTTYYNEKSIFYDEQPTRYRATVNQRRRWIRGFVDSRKKYIPRMFKKLSMKDPNFGSKVDEVFGMIAYSMMASSIALWLIALPCAMIANAVQGLSVVSLAIELGISWGLLFLAMFVLSVILVVLEGHKIKLNLSMKVRVVFYNPFYMLSYISCLIAALMAKEITWKRVEHKEN